MWGWGGARSQKKWGFQEGTCFLAVRVDVGRLPGLGEDGGCPTAHSFAKEPYILSHAWEEQRLWSLWLGPKNGGAGSCTEGSKWLRHDPRGPVSFLYRPSFAPGGSEEEEVRDGLLTALGVGCPQQQTPRCPELPEAHEELLSSWSPGRHRQPQQQCGWEGDPQTSLSCCAQWTWGAEAPCPGPAPSASRAWHSDGPRGGDCGLPATSLWSGRAVLTCSPRSGGGPRPTCTCCRACSCCRKAFMPAAKHRRRVTPSRRSCWW